MTSLLFVNNSPEPGRPNAKLGGGGRSALLIIDGLRKKGWDVSVAVPGLGPFTDAAEKLGVNPRLFPYDDVCWRRPYYSLKVFGYWHKLLKKLKPDLVVMNYPGLARNIVLAARRFDVPIVSHVRFKVTAEDYKWWLLGSYPIEGLIFNSHFLQQESEPVISSFSVRPKKQYVVHNAVDLDSFLPLPLPEEGMPLRVGMFANFTEAKNHEEFVKAAALVHEDFPQVEFVMVGAATLETEVEERIRRLVRNLGAEDYVRFLGHQEDIAGEMGRCAFTALTSRYEPFGRVLIESMACGRPVVAANVGGIPEVVEHGVTGLLYPSGDPAALAGAMAALLENRPLLEEMSRKGVERVHERFSIDSHLTRLERIYRQTILSC